MKIMNSDLILSRKVSVETWRASATIYKAEARPEYDMILKCLKDGFGTAREIAFHLLFDENSRLVVAERLLSHTVTLGLSQKERRSAKYTLTEAGERAVAQQKIFIPMEGEWEISFSRDPLLPSPIISAKEYKEPPASSEAMWKDKNTTQKRMENIQKLPQWIHQKAIDFEGVPCLGGSSIYIKELKPKGEKVVDKEAQLTVDWNVTKSSLDLLKGSKKVDLSPPDRSLNEIWLELIEQNGWMEDWNTETGELEEYFDSVPEESRKSMRVDIELPTPSISKLQRFDTAVAKGIKLRPKTKKCAQSWSEWMLFSNINDYATEERFSQWQRLALQPFKDFDLTLPSRDTLAKRIINKEAERSNTDWHILAASEWEL